LSCRFEQIQRAHGIGIEVVEGNRSGPVMTWLRRGMDDGGRLQFFEKSQNARSIPDVEFMMDKARKVPGQPLLIPPGIALRTEKNGALVVVQPMNLITKFPRKIDADLRTDKSGRAGDE
jgi:hypothetical protein